MQNDKSFNVNKHKFIANIFGKLGAITKNKINWFPAIIWKSVTFTFGSYLGHQIPALEVLNVFSVSLVSYKWVSYKENSVQEKKNSITLEMAYVKLL